MTERAKYTLIHVPPTRYPCRHGVVGNCSVRCQCGHRCDEHEAGTCYHEDQDDDPEDDDSGCHCHTFAEQGGG